MPRKRKHNGNSNNNKQPAKKKQKIGAKRILTIDQINSLEKHFYVQGFIADIGELRVNKTSKAKYKLVVIMQIKKNNILSFRIYCYGACLSMVNNMKINQWVEAFIPKLASPKTKITTTCQYIASIGNKINGTIKKIKSKSMEISINNPSKKDIEEASKNDIIRFGGVVIDIGEPQKRNTKFGPQTVTDINVNLSNVLDLTTQKWNLPKNQIEKGDIIQCFKARKNIYNGKTFVVMMEYIINANNKQCKMLQQMELKDSQELDSFDINLETEYENAEVYRIKALRQMEKQVKMANINGDKATLETFHNKRIKIVPQHVEHLPESDEYYGDPNYYNQKLNKIGNKFYNKRKQLVINPKMVYKGVFYVKDNEDHIGGIKIVSWDNVTEAFYGMNAETFCEMDTIDKVDLIDEITSNTHEFWIQIKVDEYKNKKMLKFVVEDVKPAQDESMYDYVEPDSDEEESDVEEGEFLDMCEMNATHTDDEKIDEEDEYEEDFVCSCNRNVCQCK